MFSSSVVHWDAVSLSLETLLGVSAWLIQVPYMCLCTSPTVPSQWFAVWSWAHCPSGFTVNPRLSFVQPQKRKKIISEGHGGEFISNSSFSGMRGLSLQVTLCVGSAPSLQGQMGALGHHCGGDCSYINWHNLYALLQKSPYTQCTALISLVLYHLHIV